MRARLRLLSALLALSAASAFAATDPPTSGEPYQSFRSSDRYKRIAVITPGRWSVLGGNLNGVRQNMFAHLGTMWDRCQMSGLEVHYYNTDFFELDRDHRDMWADMGAKYSLAIVLWPTSSTAGFSRYICADSTNVQVVVVGGSDQGATNNWGYSATDSSAGPRITRGLVDTKGAAGYEAAQATNNAALVTNDGVDTLWGFRFASGRRDFQLASGISRVVRLLRPFTPTGVTWVADADSINSNMPGVVSGVANDSVAAKNDYLGPIWRVDYTHGLTVDGSANTYQNSLSASLCPTSVYFVKTTTQVAIQRPYPMLLWALICRFTKAEPIRWSYDWDDITDKFGENGGNTPSVVPNSATYGPRWRQTAIDSSLRALARYGIVPTMGVQPEHAAAYYAGTGSVRYEGIMDGEARTYLRSYPWVHHSHDSSASHIGGNLLGNSGGYSSGNGGQDSQAGSTVPAYSRRFASRWNPGANQGGFIGAGGNFGIVQRLAYGDSLRRSIGNPNLSPPYMIFPSNRMLPVNWKARSIAVTGWNRHYGPITSSADSLCPIDSVLWALDYSLNARQTSGLGKLVLRASLDDPRGQVGQLTIGANIQWDRDSVVAASIFMYPGERFTTRVGGRLIQATCVNSRVLVGANGTTRAGYISEPNSTVAFLLGLKNPLRFADANAMYDGETFNSDVQGVYQTPASYPGTHDFAGRQASSVIYQHPGQVTAVPSKYGCYEVDIFINTIASWMHAMDGIAGRATTVCVPGWRSRP